MATRHERVIIDLDDRFTRPMAGAAASTALFRKNVDESGRSVVEFDRTVKSTSPSIDQLSGRLAILGRAAVALGPGFAPIATAAVPAIAGLSTQLGFAAAGAGTAILAFNGVGDALKAVNDYQLKPTAENFAKLQEKLHGLGPAAREFVFYLDEIGPKLQTIRKAAQDGLLPGVQEGIEGMMSRLPQVRRIVSEIAEASGDLIAGAGQDLGSGHWDEFFNFLETEARPALIELGQTAGHVASGIAELWMALNPLSDDFTGGLLDASAAFEEWASSLSETQGFQEFLAYVRETGPQVLDTLGSVANMLLQVAEAAAPMGGPVLKALEVFADVIATIADSDIGTPLLAAAGAMSALSLASAGFAKVTGSTAVASVRGLTADLKTMGQVGIVSWARTTEGAEKYAAASGRVRSSLAGLGKQAAVVGGLAVATSGLADSTGLSNTASMALMGTIAGPWGAAIGGSVGLVMDFVAANNKATDAIKAFDSAAGSATSLSEYSAAVANLRSEYEDFRTSVTGDSLFGHIGESLTPAGARNNLDLIFGGYDGSQLQKMADKAEEAERAVGDLQFSLMHFADLKGTETQAEALAKMEQGLRNAQPALDALGYSMQDLIDAASQDGGAGIQRIVAEVEAYNSAADTAAGRSKAVGDAMADLAGQMESNVTQAEALKNAMDSLFGVELSQSEATDQWTQSLKDLRDQLAETNGALVGNSDAALANRDAIRNNVQSLQDKVAADAAAGVAGDKLVSSLLQGRKAIVDQAVAAGASRKEVARYLDTLGLTPKNLSTIIETPGLLTAKQQVQALGKLYGLTPKEVRTLLAAKDGASVPTKALKAIYDKLDKRQINTLLRAIDQASGTANRLLSIYHGLDRTFTSTIITNHVDKFERMTGSADGSTVPKDGRAYADRYPYLLAPGEEVISNRHGQADRWRPLLKAINANRLADGGTVGLADGGTAKKRDPFTGKEYRQETREFNLTGDQTWREVKAELRDFAREVREAGGNVGKGFDRISQRAVNVARSLDRHEKALEKDRERLQSLRQSRGDYAAEVRGTFRHDLFGNGAAGALLQLQADANDANAMRAALTRAARRGLDGGLYKELAASGDLNTAQQFAGFSAAQIRQYERAYAGRESAVGALGNQAADKVFGAQIDQQNRMIQRLERQMDRNTKTLNKIESAVERGARRGVGDRDRTASNRRRTGQ